MINLPKGIYYKTGQVHSIQYTINNKNFTLSADSFKALETLINDFFNPNPAAFRTVDEYNVAFINSKEDTIIIPIREAA